VTVLEIIKLSTEYLEKKGVDSPRLQIELLLAHVLSVPRLRLYLDFERKLSETELQRLRQLVKRRGDREPLQYLVGTTSFCGLELAVTPAVLIPRPETELLVEEAWKFLEAQSKPVAILDFGTGSGCIAIAIAHKFPTFDVHGIDASEAALEVARGNAERIGATVHFHHARSIAEVPEPAAVDLLVSNPPYIPAGEIPSLQPEVRDHEPRTALEGGVDGLEFYRMIADQSAGRLSPQGRVILELGHDQEAPVQAIFSQPPWNVERVVRDYAGTPRILIARRCE
jgi:release factor glutamine methyltransferase